MKRNKTEHFWELTSLRFSKNKILISISRQIIKSIISPKQVFLFALIILTQSIAAQINNALIKVIDNEGKPIASAKVELLSETDRSKLTDTEGVAEFTIEPTGLIKVSFRDMEKTVKFNASNISVQLGKSDKKLDVGFGDKKSSDRITSSIDVVYSDDLQKNFALNPAESLFGQLAGLTVLQNGGDPWARSPDMLIRGKGTFNNNSLLVLVDGFERDISSLALENIESIAVLKDGAAQALYGQRGANGVLLVTTKRGEYNSFHVDVSYERGLNMPFRMPEFLNAYEYAKSVNRASILDGNSDVYSENDLQDFQNGTKPYFFPDVDWFDETLKDQGTSMNFNTNFRGGGDQIKYFVSLNYQNERGILENTDLDERYDSQMKYDRFNFRTNLDIDLTSSTKFYVNVAGDINARKEPGARVTGVMDALYSVPSAAFPVETFNGVWGGTEYYNNNPVALESSTGLRQPQSRGINADGRLIQDFSNWIDGLSAEIATAYDNRVAYWESKTRDFLYESLVTTRNPETGEITDTAVARYGSDTDLNYNDSFGGQQRHATFYGKLNYNRSWGNSDLYTYLMYHMDKRVNDGQYNTFLHQNIVASASYSFNDRYFIDGLISYNGSSRLPDGERFGVFPAISAGWIINREDFLKNSDIINNLKLRASWGMVGNDIMAPNLYDQAYFSGGTYFFTDNNNNYGGIIEGQLPSIGLRYEKSAKSNIGVDVELFGKLSLTLDAFYEKRTNLLVSISGSIPTLIGVNRPVENVGEVENKGFEAILMWNDNLGDFKYHLGGNFSFARNEIIEMNEEFKPYDYLKETGNPVGQQFGLETVGFFEDENDILNSPRQLFSEVRPGDVKYKDQNDDGVVDELDIVPMGYAGGYPEIYFAFNAGIEFKGFGLDALFQGIANQTLYLNTKSVFWPLRGQNNISTFSEDAWTPQTAGAATLPRLSLLENANNYRKNDIWLTKGNYLKLRHLEIYYKLPEPLLNSLNMKSARIFARGINLFSIDEIDILDPEEIGVSYPTLTSYYFGINLGF